MVKTRWIWITFQKEGIHCYPAAKTDPKLASVAFLGNEHRHMFHFQVKVEVFHNDRDIEFLIEKRKIEALYGTSLVLNYKSCEMIAEELHSIIGEWYIGRRVEITVSEDGENGCTLEFDAIPTDALPKSVDIK